MLDPYLIPDVVGVIRQYMNREFGSSPSLIIDKVLERILYAVLLKDGRIATFAGDDIIRVWDLRDGKCEHMLSCLAGLLVESMQVISISPL